jgi:hypothetical protein
MEDAMELIDQICDVLTDEMAAIRKRRATFEKMGNDDAVRSLDGDLDIVKGLSDKILALIVRNDIQRKRA